MPAVRRLILVAVCAATAASCTVTADPIDEFPTFYAQVSGKEWRGDAGALLLPGGTAGDTLYIFGASPVNAGSMVRETLRVRIIVKDEGTYLLGPGAVVFDELIGGDVVAASYSTTDTSVGRVILTRYDGLRGLVEGSIEFDAETTSPYGSYGRKASLRQGFFTAVVKPRSSS